jgi:site-specific DNA recombinase
LFYDVQDVLNGNRRIVPLAKMVSDEELPLRGFLICPTCGRTMSGSASRGRHGGYYHYYHCKSSCKCRVRAYVLNDYFADHLMDYQISPAMTRLFKAVILDVFQKEQISGIDRGKGIADQIEIQERMLSNARKHFMMEEIDAKDFKAIKTDYANILRSLESKLAEMPNRAESLKTVENLLDIVIERYSDIQMHFKSATIIEKRKLIGSMYPEKLCFENTTLRTPKANTVLNFILQANKQLGAKNKEEKYDIVYFSSLVARRVT